MSQGIIIPEAWANQMKYFFDADNPVKGYVIEKAYVIQVLALVHSVLMQGYENGLYLHIGKTTPDIAGNIPWPFNIVAEPVFYKEPSRGHDVNHTLDIPASEAGFDQAFNMANKTFYPKSTWSNFVAVKDAIDPNPVQQVFINCNILEQFLENTQTNYELLKVEFARNAILGRITTILSCFSGTGTSPLISTINVNGPVYEGFYQDENNLIPPPPF